MKYFVKLGEHYERLEVLATHQRVEGKRELYNLCRCACGNKCHRTSRALVRKLTTSCGCARRERQKRGNFIHGGSGAAYLYQFWLRTRSRCHNPADEDYPLYGGKGIALAEQWRKRRGYSAFRDWVETNLGPHPAPGYRLERWQREKGFEPGNLLWVTGGQAYALRNGLVA